MAKTEILNRYTKAVIFSGEYATIKGAVVAAVKAGVCLSYADLRGADLRGADLRGADLRGADLAYAYLAYANLAYAYLAYANLSGANLSGANLRGTNLYGADLSGANLRGTNLYGADLSGAKIDDIQVARLSICPEGAFTGWKKCSGGALVKLQIPEDARRSNATGRKCRAEFVDVLEVIGAPDALSRHDGRTIYRAGERVTCNEWCDDRWKECAGGIHFYITRLEAENHP